MISKCQKKIRATSANNSPNKVTQLQHGNKNKPSNFSLKYDFVCCIFQTFITKNRMPNHRKNGKKRYFLLPQWITMSHRNSNIPPEQSLSFTFNTLLTSLYDEGTNATDIMSDVFCRSVNITLTHVLNATH